MIVLMQRMVWTSQILFDLKCSGVFRLSINRNSLVLRRAITNFYEYYSRKWN